MKSLEIEKIAYQEVCNNNNSIFSSLIKFFPLKCLKIPF